MSMEATTIGSLISLQRGYDLTETQRHPGKVPIVGSAGVHGYHDKARAKGPGVALGRSGASFGKVTYVNEDYWPHNTTIFVTDFKGNEPLFIRYLLESLDFSSLNSGSAQQSLNRNYVYMVPVKQFSLPIQRRIAGILSAYDDLIENSQRRIKILEEMARRLYREWFVHFRFPGHEGCTFVESPLGEIPEGWRIEPLGNIAQITMGLSPKGDSYNEEAIGTPLINGPVEYGERFPKRIKWTTSPTKTCSKGSLIICVRGSTTGKYVKSDGEYCLGRGVCSLSSGFQGFADQLFISELPVLLRQAGGSTFPSWTTNQLLNHQVISPPLVILTRFEEVAKPINEQISVIDKQIQNLRRTRDLLLPRLLSGQIDVEALPEPGLTEP
jgi:type I restriction enzyme S subunit